MLNYPEKPSFSEETAMLRALALSLILLACPAVPWHPIACVHLALTAVAFR